MVAVGSCLGTGVFVGVGGNQTTVGVGVSVGAGVAVGVGGIGVGEEQDASKNAKRQIGKYAKMRKCNDPRLLICQFASLPTCLRPHIPTTMLLNHHNLISFWAYGCHANWNIDQDFNAF
jgi:hypothetical protein